MRQDGVYTRSDSDAVIFAASAHATKASFEHTTSADTRFAKGSVSYYLVSARLDLKNLWITTLDARQCAVVALLGCFVLKLENENGYSLGVRRTLRNWPV